MNFLFLSNGYGEDAIGVVLAREFLKISNEINIKILPLVGLGLAYHKLKNDRVEILGPVKEMPSGGFIRGPYWILRDLLAGLPFLVLRQINQVKKQSLQVDYVIAIGDIWPLYLASKIAKKPVFFLSTAKSSWVGEHTHREEELMKNFALKVFPRDEKTAESLKRKGINAEFLGNIMMDCLFEEKKMEPPLSQFLSEGEVIGILPGSRQEAYQNLIIVLEGILKLIADSKENLNLNFVVALAPSLKIEQIIAVTQNHGWFYEPAIPVLRKSGILGKLKLKEAGDFFADNQEISVILTIGRFAEVLNSSKFVIGLAGTANEQAVGLGKPVIAFPGRGPQITFDFLKNQQKLLGGAVEIVLPRPDCLALKIKSLLNDTARYEEVKKIGRERMGAPGGAQKIANAIIQIINKNNG